jgi:hypothetical protein
VGGKRLDLGADAGDAFGVGKVVEDEESFLSDSADEPFRFPC